MDMIIINNILNEAILPLSILIKTCAVFQLLKNQTTFVWVTYCYAFNVVDLQIKA